MKKYLKALALAALVASGGAAGGQSAAGGNSSAAATCAITVSPWAYPGDCVAVRFTPGEAPFLSNGECSLVNPAGNTATSAKAFVPEIPASGKYRAFPRSGHALAALVAIVAIPAETKAGTYAIRSSCKARRIEHGPETAIFAETPVEIRKKRFPAETVVLDSANGAIKTDTSAEKLAQTERLSAILFSFDENAPRFSGPFIPPVASRRRTSAFAHKRTYVYPNAQTSVETHAGIDFGVPKGTPVRASGAGLVVMAEKRISTGWTVVIEHAPGVYSLYYHLSVLFVAPGDTVRAGALVARSGNTGLSTGPHLHWEFRVNGTPVSPDWFAGKKIW